jgi:hypothetical protein
MVCTSCGSNNLRKFKGEVSILLPRFEDRFEPTVLAQPEFVICLACGVAQFTVLDRELRLLLKTDADAGFSHD